MSLPVSPSLLTRLLRLAGHLDAAQALAELVSAAADHTGAKYAAIASIDAFGETTEFHQRGIDEETAAVLGRPPRGHGVLAPSPTTACCCWRISPRTRTSGASRPVTRRCTPSSG